jgi:hypothetical protein
MPYQSENVVINFFPASKANDRAVFLKAQILQARTLSPNDIWWDFKQASFTHTHLDKHTSSQMFLTSRLHRQLVSR